MTTRHRPRLRAAALLAAAALSLTACGGAEAHRLTDSEQGRALQSIPSRSNGKAVLGLQLTNRSADALTMTSATLVGAKRMRVEQQWIAPILHEGRMRVGIGFNAYPGEGEVAQMLAAKRPLRGFVLPARSHDRWQIVLLVAADDPAAPARTDGVDVHYRAAGADATERLNSGACFHRRGHEGDCRLDPAH